MQKPLLKTFGDTTYQLVLMGAWEQVSVFHSLVTVLGSMTPVIADMVGSDKKKSLVERVDLGKLFEALPTFLERTHPAKQRELAEQLLNGCTFRKPTPKGRPPPDDELPLLMPVFDEEMKGKLLIFYKLLAFAIESNFADFFGGVKAAIAAKQIAAADAAPPKTPASTPSDATEG